MKNTTSFFLFKRKFLPVVAIILVFAFLVTQCKKSGNGNNPPPGSLTYNLQMVTDNLVSPLTVASPPDGSNRLFILDQIGKIYIVQPGGTKLATPFIDVSAKMVSLNAGYDER